jgi:hypothetical protein
VAGLLIRAALVVIGLGLMLLGLVAVSVPEIGPGGLVWVLSGGVLVVAVALERQRYRSEAAERSHATAGPGGGETSGASLEPRFRPTAEVFVDPSSGRQMRVLADPTTGERRYVAEA